MADHAIIEFDQVGKSFGQFQAVKNVNLSVRRGEFVALLGPSGCGKSTLLNMAAGLFRPTQGHVRYDGAEVVSLNHKTGYMTQSDHLLPWRNVIDNIAVAYEIKGMNRKASRKQVEPLIDLVGLSGFEGAYPSQLSGGMRKRAALARLLAYDPEALLMDEPFAALDAQLRLTMQIELLRICRQFDKTVLFVTHDLDEAVALADRVALFGPSPGTIVRTIDSPLERDRDLLRLRSNPAFNAATAELWELMTPNLFPDSERRAVDSSKRES